MITPRCSTSRMCGMGKRESKWEVIRIRSKGEYLGTVRRGMRLRRQRPLGRRLRSIRSKRSGCWYVNADEDATESEFDPTHPAFVHDELNDRVINRGLEWAEHYRKHAIFEPNGKVGWDGLILDGWRPAV
jgi:hypothetical protein